MGGNAFTSLGYEAKRMPKETFERVKKDIYDFLTSLGIEYLDIESIKDKTDFGDLDILVVEDGSGVFDKIKSNLSSIGIPDKLFIHSGFCCSALYEEKYQIDFIKTREDYKEYHQKYLSHNDLGNLIGRCVKESYFKHGHDGFYYTYYDGTRIKKDILISTDYREVLSVLGLSVEEFDQGFDTLTDMFDYVAKNKYFKASFYAYDKLNNRNRVRDSKRKNYRLFLEHISSMVDSTEKLPTYKELYPHIQKDIDLIIAEGNKINKLKEKFDGSLVMALTGMTGKKLGDFIGKFKKTYDDDFLLTLEKEEIEKLILKFHENLLTDKE